MTVNLKIEQFARKTFVVDAIQVTEDNFEEVAKWCHGDVRTLVNHHKGTKTKYVKVRVYRPMKDRQTQAFIGDRILYAGNGFKVYSPMAFENAFEPLDTKTCKCLDPSQCAPFNGNQAAKTDVVFEDGAQYTRKVTDWEGDQTNGAEGYISKDKV